MADEAITLPQSSVHPESIIGYSYLNHGREPLRDAFAVEFVKGVQGLSNRDMFIFQENHVTPQSLLEKDIDSLVEQELKSIFNNEEGGYDFSEVEAGMTPMGFVHFSFNQHVYDWLLTNLQKYSRLNTINYNLIKEILEDFSITKDTIRNVSSVAKNVSEYVQHIPCDSLGGVVSLALFFGVTTAICKVYEECSILQSKDKRDNKTIKWNIRVEKDVYHDDPLQRAELATLLYLRESILLNAEDRPISLRQPFDKYKLTSAYDEFRLNIARLNPKCNDERAVIISHEYFEMDSFQSVYRHFSQEQKRMQTTKEQEMISKVKEKYFS